MEALLTHTAEHGGLSVVVPVALAEGLAAVVHHPLEAVSLRDGHGNHPRFLQRRHHLRVDRRRPVLSVQQCRHLLAELFAAVDGLGMITRVRSHDGDVVADGVIGNAEDLLHRRDLLPLRARRRVRQCVEGGGEPREKEHATKNAQHVVVLHEVETHRLRQQRVHLDRDVLVLGEAPDEDGEGEVAVAGRDAHPLGERGDAMECVELEDALVGLALQQRRHPGVSSLYMTRLSWEYDGLIEGGVSCVQLRRLRGGYGL